jgi:hypothetical protein
MIWNGIPDENNDHCDVHNMENGSTVDDVKAACENDNGGRWGQKHDSKHLGEV